MWKLPLEKIFLTLFSNKEEITLMTTLSNKEVGIAFRDQIPQSSRITQ